MDGAEGGVLRGRENGRAAKLRPSAGKKARMGFEGKLGTALLLCLGHERQRRGGPARRFTEGRALWGPSPARGCAACSGGGSEPPTGRWRLCSGEGGGRKLVDLCALAGLAPLGVVRGGRLVQLPPHGGLGQRLRLVADVHVAHCGGVCVCGGGGACSAEGGALSAGEAWRGAGMMRAAARRARGGGGSPPPPHRGP